MGNDCISRNNENSKEILQFWSGGADSTYLLLQNLLANNTVVATYVDILNNENKVDREKAARNLLKEDIAKFCDYFKCARPLILEDNSIHIKGGFLDNCLAPQQIIFAMFALLNGNGFDEIQMGVVLGDSMHGSSLNSDFVKAYRNNLGYFPNITYPIENVSKETIYITLQGYDMLIGTNFIGHITCCENPNEPCDNFKKCHSCRTQMKVFKKLKWVKTPNSTHGMRQHISHKSR